MTKPVKLTPEIKKRLSRLRREREAREKYYREYKHRMESAKSAIFNGWLKI
jgi:uncharacterized protein involved in exopolysaccharide biosynthesis